MKNNYVNTDSNKRYYTLDYFYKQKFHKKVAKISLNAGFTCPNKDGKKGTGGCIYCSKSGSGDFAGNKEEDVVTQFHKIQEIMERKWKDTFYIGYFQANTNTYAEIAVLKQKYEPILEIDNVVGLSIATRPDAISEECLDYLEELNQRTFLTIELGLQTIHEVTSKRINRGHDLDCFKDMVEKLRKRQISVVVHIINGLPYETKEMMIDTIRYLNQLDIQGIKIHMLHIIEDTVLANLYKEEQFPVLTKEEYVDIVCDQLEILKENIVVHRITGDPNQSDLIEPDWLIKKMDVLNSIDKELERRHTYQGFQSSISNRLQERIDYYLKPNSLIVDATVGTGINAYYISNCITVGHIFGFGIQKEATEKLVNEISNEKITLYPKDCKNMQNVLYDYIGKISIILLNSEFFTEENRNVEMMIEAIKESIQLIHEQGVVLVTALPSSENEDHLLKEFLKDKRVTYYSSELEKNGSYLIEIRKNNYGKRI